MPGLTIGQLANVTQVSAATIRFYERKGLLSAPGRRRSGYRQYEAINRRQLLFIRCARELGFSLDDVAELLALHVSDDRKTARVTVDKFQKTVASKIAALQTCERGLLELKKAVVDRWSDEERAFALDLFDPSLLKVKR